MGIYIGLMSGTSVDSVDSVVVDFIENNVKIINKKSYPIKDDLKNRIFSSVYKESIKQKEIKILDKELGELFGRAAKEIIQDSSLSLEDIKAIGSHGQTIKHSPEGPKPFSLQVGSAMEITKITGIKTVTNFREADVKAGGQGAPLSPLFHEALFKMKDISKGVVINIGGISNLSNINLKINQVTAYDSGPGNCLMDAWSKRHLSKNFDQGGAWASKGKYNEKLLNIMLEDSFFHTKNPKSTGTEYFNLEWLEKRLKELSEDISNEDTQATLCELTAKSIFNELVKTNSLNKKIYICGGGIHNKFLIKRLDLLIEGRTLSTESLGIDPDYMEAICFAWLAKQRLKNREFDLSSITGSTRRVILGEIS